MANKKKIEERQKALRAQQTEKSIRIAGIVIVLLLAVGVIWLVVPSRGSNVLELPAGTSLQYDAPPPMTIDTKKKYFATFSMAEGGEFVVELLAEKAPRTVNNFVFLAQNGYYNGTTFHRVLEGFMAQGGDPTGTGRGGPGYQFEDEFSDLTFDKAGLLAMANSGANTNGSQFFITYAPTPHLNGRHTIFGRVVQAMDVVNGITPRNPEENPTFQGDVIETITITEQ
ncbi:MAG TPA: peptidylprolyl isomerase [Anaerolineales bacterium]